MELTRLGLKKPELTDPADIRDINYNMDKLTETIEGLTGYQFGGVITADGDTVQNEKVYKVEITGHTDDGKVMFVKTGTTYANANKVDVKDLLGFKGKNVEIGEKASEKIEIGKDSTGGIEIGSTQGTQANNKLIVGTKSASFEEIIETVLGNTDIFKNVVHHNSTWRNVKDSRTANTAYQNDTGRMIKVLFGTGGDYYDFDIRVDSVSLLNIDNFVGASTSSPASGSQSIGYTGIEFSVPAGSSYEINASDTNQNQIGYWSELRHI